MDRFKTGDRVRLKDESINRNSYLRDYIGIEGTVIDDYNIQYCHFCDVKLNEDKSIFGSFALR